MVNSKQLLDYRCGDDIEDADHFLLTCDLYQDSRRNLTDATNYNLFQHDIDTLLYGNENLTDVENDKIFELVQLFIEMRDRFSK